MSLLAEVSRVLAARGAAHAVIGATALAAHGVTRSTADLDLLTTDVRCLDPSWWRAFDAEVRRGDVEDPLAGVVRVERSGEAPVDVIVGREPWQGDVVQRAVPAPIAGATVPIVRAADLVLLKLYAGGPQDAWDVLQLRDAVPGLDAEVEARLGALPAECRALWRRVVAGTP